MIVECLFIVLLLATSIIAQNEIKKPTLHILGVFPMSGSWPAGSAASIAAQMAIEHVNTREDILPWYDLSLHILDSKCDVGQGLNELFRELYRQPTKIAVFGGGCSIVSEPIAACLPKWNMFQLSWAPTSPSLSNSQKYPNFMRIVPPNQLRNAMKVKLIKHYGWTKVATISQAYDLYALVTKDLVEKLMENNIKVLSSEVFTDDATDQVKNLKKHDARIIFAGSYQDAMFNLLCTAYHEGIYGAKYVWMMPDWYMPNWYKTEAEKSTKCSSENIELVLYRQFVIGTIVKNPDIHQESPVEQMSYYEFDKLYKEAKAKLNKPQVLPGDDYSANTYDGIWAMAIAFNKTAENGYDLSAFTYDSYNMTQEILRQAKRLSFITIAKGSLVFTEDGDPMSTYVLSQYGMGSRQTVLYYHSITDELEWLQEIEWANGKVPKDGIIYEIETVFISLSSYITICTFAALGALLSCAFLVFNIAFRNEKIVKMSSPNLNNVILVGCICLYGSVCLQNLNSIDTTAILILCRSNGYLFLFGFSLVFGGLLSKTWRVYKIFTKTEIGMKPIKDIELFAKLLILLGVNAAIVVLWEVVDGLEVEKLESRSDALDDVVVISQQYRCNSAHQMKFMGGLIGIQGVLLLFGAFLAFETRTVKIEALNDSQAVGICVYNVTVLSVVGVLFNFMVGDQVEVVYIITSILIILGTTLTQMVLFIPKIRIHWQIKKGTMDIKKATTTMNSSATK